jgi:hypothetical protein
VEKQLVAKAQSVAEQGFGISRKQLICKAGRLAKTLKLKTLFKGRVGWMVSLHEIMNLF